MVYHILLFKYDTFPSLLRPIIKVSYKNTNEIQTITQNKYLKSPNVIINILSASCSHKVLNYTIVKNKELRFETTGRPHIGCFIQQAVSHSLMLLKMGKTTARNMSS
jgi:hypothetical protein